MQEHIRRAHPDHYIPKLPATEESFLLMVNSPPTKRPPPEPTSVPTVRYVPVADCNKPTPVIEISTAQTSVLLPRPESVTMHNLRLPTPQLPWHSFIMINLGLSGTLTWSVNIYGGPLPLSCRSLIGSRMCFRNRGSRESSFLVQ